jgi:hypothetical protein
MVEIIAVIRDIPDQQKGLTNVLIGSPAVPIDRGVDQLTDCIHKDHDIFLQ